MTVQMKYQEGRRQISADSLSLVLSRLVYVPTQWPG
jgi:hypothetical protein